MSDYEIGYGKPPTHSRFKKGVSGNPSGRPKREVINLEETVTRILNESVEISKHGKRERASRLELAIKKSIVDAVGGDVSSAAWLLKLRANTIIDGEVERILIKIEGGMPDPSSPVELKLGVL